MVTVLSLSAVDRGFEPQSGKIKDYKIGMCCFSAKHAALRRNYLFSGEENLSMYRQFIIKIEQRTDVFLT
jgi:hypothetical protein